MKVILYSIKICNPGILNRIEQVLKKSQQLLIRVSHIENDVGESRAACQTLKNFSMLGIRLLLQTNKINSFFDWLQNLDL